MTNFVSKMPAPKPTATRKLSFPILQRIRLAHFSLYTLKDTIEFKFDDGIVCLARMFHERRAATGFATVGAF